MSHHTPTTHQTLEDYLLYSSPADVFLHPAMPRTAMWGLVLSLLAITGCARGPEHHRPLHRAAAEAREDDVRSLLAQGEDPNVMDAQDPWTPLMIAARAGELGTMRALLAGGADPNLRDLRNGWTALLHAVHKNQNGAALLLVDGGADVNARQPGAFAALTMAAGYGNTALVRELLKRGANVGESEIMVAVSGVPDIDRFTLGSCQTETVRALLDGAPRARIDHLAERLQLRLTGWFGCAEAVQLVQARLQKTLSK